MKLRKSVPEQANAKQVERLLLAGIKDAAFNVQQFRNLRLRQRKTADVLLIQNLILDATIHRVFLQTDERPVNEVDIHARFANAADTLSKSVGLNVWSELCKISDSRI